MAKRMNRFARSAADQTGLPSYLHGRQLAEPDDGGARRRLRLYGDVVAKLVDHPRGLVDFRLADLYRPLTGS